MRQLVNVSSKGPGSHAELQVMSFHARGSTAGVGGGVGRGRRCGSSRWDKYDDRERGSVAVDFTSQLAPVTRDMSTANHHQCLSSS